MPVNRNALVRYKTIDNCLQNHYRLWTLDDLIKACSNALYEFEGILKGVSKRTIQADIQVMRSNKLGYNAPIIVQEKKYYSYEDPDYSITNIPISDQDLDNLYASVEFLKQFKGFSHFKELGSMVQKLEDHVYSQKNKQRPVIDFEKNESLKGLDFLDELYNTIISKRAIQLTYQSFKARQEASFNFHPYLLKEFRNRWFVIGKKSKFNDLTILALDRIVKIEKTNIPYRKFEQFNSEEYFKHAIGVSVSAHLPPERVILFVIHKHAPYILTKPFHPSQKQIDKNYYGITISLDVQHNFELEKEILSLGDGIKVIAPNRLKRNIKNRISGALDLYETEINNQGLIKVAKQLNNKGFSSINKTYTTRDINKLRKATDRFIKENNIADHQIIDLLQSIPDIEPTILNMNIAEIIKAIDSSAILKNTFYFDNRYSDHPILNTKSTHSLNKDGFYIHIFLDDIDQNNGAFQIFPGSHKNKLAQAEIQLIKDNSYPVTLESNVGSVLITNKFLIQSVSEGAVRKRGRIVCLEYLSGALESC